MDNLGWLDGHGVGSAEDLSGEGLGIRVREDAVGVGLVRWAGVGFGSEEQKEAGVSTRAYRGGNGGGQGGR